MKCTEFEKLVDGYIDGELSHSLTEFEEHLGTCQSCQQLYKETLEIKELLNDLEEVDLPDDFEASLHDKLVEVSKELKVIPFYKKTRTLRVMTSVAAVAVISIFAFKAGTLVPNSNNNMLYGSMDVSHNADMDKEAMPEMAMNMAMDDSAEETEEAAFESDEVVGLTSYTANEEPMAKSIRMEMDNDIYSPESVNYWLDVDTNTDQLNDFINLYETIDFEVDEDNRYTFYINTEDFDVFSENIMNNFDVTNEFVLEFSTGLENILIQFNDQLKIVDNLEEQSDADGNALESENHVLDGLNQEVEKINYYQDKKQITITINKE